MHNRLFVFDIETVPDTDVLYSLTGSMTQDIQEKRKEMEKYHIEISGGNPFPRQPFHKVVSISMLIANITKKGDYDFYDNFKLGAISSTKFDEREMVERFFEYVCSYLPKIVSYNGKGFDIPVLKYRAIKYGISLENLFKAGDKWSNYHQKYAKDWHCDLLDVFSDYGLSSKCKMHEICAIAGLPGKIGVDGSQVTELYDNNRLEEIDDYCETDVANTYLLYLNYCLISGIISKEIFIELNKNFIEFLTKEDKNNYKEFLAAWKKVDQRGLFV
ncbi:MAG: 3'-5' exonuclease [Rickettsiales bacterium]|jgi:predicted PolB exonuclease-like 3'-5' exonuclease|nr:3'-5' exonuclease [Rickettsiales bacterium]